jgi:protein transport protein SEC24
MASFHGNFFVRSTDLLAMPAVPQDQSYAIEIQIEDTITAPFVMFQVAVLHTTCYGEPLHSPFVVTSLLMTFV